MVIGRYRRTSQRLLSATNFPSCRALRCATPPAAASFVATTAWQPPVLPVTFPAYMIWGANTDVGKTLVSAGLAAAADRLGVSRLCTLA